MVFLFINIIILTSVLQEKKRQKCALC